MNTFFKNTPFYCKKYCSQTVDDSEAKSDNGQEDENI